MIEAEAETPWYELFWQYLVAAKQQVCPVIRYSYNKEDV